MTGETPLEITHVRDRLLQDFSGRIPEAVTGEADERERNFLTRALAAFAVHKLTGCSLDDAAAAVVDGGGDGGIDALHYASASSTLWVAQSKFFADGQGEPSLGDVSKFRDGMEALLRGDFDVFDKNPLIKQRKPLIRRYFDDASLQVRAVLVYSGVQLVSEDRIRLFERLRDQFSADIDYFTFQRFNLTSVHGWLVGAGEPVGVSKVRLELLRPACLPEPYETHYGLVSLTSLAELYKRHEKQLVAANLREYKGSTDVNDRILSTLKTEPAHFVYFNNGLTAYCRHVDVDNLDKGNTQRKWLTAYDFCIVNGAQTLGSIGTLASGSDAVAPEGYVFIRLVSLERCEDDREFARRITQNTNYQNQIDLRDFVALDDEQHRIQSHLDLSGIHYHFKEGEDVPAQDETNFTLEEATTALACLEPLAPDRKLDFCVRVLANRSSLWSLEDVFGEPGSPRSRYQRLFRPDRSVRTIWRAVQAKRAVISRMQENGRAATGKLKEFYENSRWLVLHIIFQRVHPERGEELTLTAKEKTSLVVETDSISVALWKHAEAVGATRHFRSVFCDTADCRRLKGATFAELDRGARA